MTVDAALLSIDEAERIAWPINETNPFITFPDKTFLAYAPFAGEEDRGTHLARSTPKGWAALLELDQDPRGEAMLPSPWLDGGLLVPRATERARFLETTSPNAPIPADLARTTVASLPTGDLFVARAEDPKAWTIVRWSPRAAATTHRVELARPVEVVAPWKVIARSPTRAIAAATIRWAGATSDETALATFDGSTWTRLALPSDGIADAVELGPDGTVHLVAAGALWRKRAAGAWECVALPEHAGIVPKASQVRVAGDGRLWVVAEYEMGHDVERVLLRDAPFAEPYRCTDVDVQEWVLERAKAAFPESSRGCRHEVLVVPTVGFSARRGTLEARGPLAGRRVEQTTFAGGKVWSIAATSASDAQALAARLHTTVTGALPRPVCRGAPTPPPTTY